MWLYNFQKLQSHYELWLQFVESWGHFINFEVTLFENIAVTFRILLALSKFCRQDSKIALFKLLVRHSILLYDAKLDLTKIYFSNLISTSTLLSCINYFHWWGILLFWFSLILYMFSSSCTYLYIAFVCIYILLNSFEYATLIFF